MTSKGQGFRILLVEDNEADAVLVQDLLETELEAVTVAHDDRLSAALSRFGDERFDCVLLDLGLPDSQGIETLSLLRAENVAVPVIVLTGLDDEDLGLEALREGAQEYLVKGRVDARLLRRAVSYAIERKRMDEAKSQFIARAAHELRTPLAVLAGLGESIATGLERVDAEQRAEILGAMGRQARRARTLIAQLLDLSQAELGRVHLREQQLDVAALIAGAVETVPPPDGTVLQTSAPGDLTASGDHVRVEQILVNLLTNAYRYGGSSVTVAAEPVGDGVAISITDDGPGMSADVRAHLFEPFVRGSQEDQEGSGLGLAICRRLAEAMHGDLSLDESAAGTRFVLTLPV